ncbi:hypothetical protein [Tsuneonella sp. HG222]
MSGLPPGFVLDSEPSQGPVYGPPPKAPAPVDPLVQRQRELSIAKAERDLSEPAGGQDAPSGYRWGANGTLEAIPGGPADKTKAPTKIADRAKLATLESIVGQINRVEELYRAGIRDESLWNAFGALDGFGPSAGEFNSAGEGMADQGLAAFKVPGMGSQSDRDAMQFAAANTPNASDWDKAIEQKLRNLKGRVDANREVFGLPPAEWLPSEEDDYAPKVLSSAPQQYEAAQGVRSTMDPEMSARLDKLIKAGAPLSAINSMLSSRGFDPIPPEAYDQWRSFLAENPGYEGTSAEAIRNEPLSSFEQTITDIGSGAAGAYALGAGQFLSGNTLDNLAGNPEQARLALAQAQQGSPNAYGLGELSGGIMAGLSGEAGLARLGMGSGLIRGAAGDAIAGAANGAGMADGGNRFAGAGQGAVSAGLGSLAGGTAMKGVGRALSPSGGNLASLYAEGVRPTPGQRFADSGVIGRAVNATEEALQSVPIVGAAITGARQEARDQFQIGAFNQALREIGEELPKGMKPGTDPNKYAQQAFARVYDEARSGMKVLVDEELTNDLQALAPDIQTLGPAAQNKLRSIMANTIKDDLSGDIYKRAMSDLGKHIARSRKGLTGEDQALADVLEGVRDSLDGAARRHSDPEAVALLDRADAGYAKLVRIEDAARRRGGDAGTFTPANLDAAVQNTSGGVRSKAYLRGEANMQDYATQGRQLGDRMANSGTFDRSLAATTVAGGVAYVEPTTLGVLASIGAAYAPGVRKVTKGAFAPSAGKRKAIAAKLKKIERLSAGATGALALQGTSPGQ